MNFVLKNNETLLENQANIRGTTPEVLAASLKSSYDLNKDNPLTKPDAVNSYTNLLLLTKKNETCGAILPGSYYKSDVDACVGSTNTQGFVNYVPLGISPTCKSSSWIYDVDKNTCAPPSGIVATTGPAAAAAIPTCPEGYYMQGGRCFDKSINVDKTLYGTSTFFGLVNKCEDGYEKKTYVETGLFGSIGNS